MLDITSKLGLSAESATTLQGVDKKVAVQSYKAENRCVSSKALYTDTHCVTALHSYTAIQRYIIQLYSAIHYTTSTTPLWGLALVGWPPLGRCARTAGANSRYLNSARMILSDVLT